MQRGRFYLTEKGRDLLAYCQSGEPLNFTRAAIGSGKIENTSALFKMDTLVQEVQEVDIRGIKANGDGTSTISLAITNNKTKKGFLMSEVGLFAQDPRKGEILYGVAYYEDHADYIPVHDQEMVEISMDIIVVVANVDNININIDRSMICASQLDLMDLAGRGRTNQTVKGNWDLIQDLALKIAAMGTAVHTDTRYNNFKVDFKQLEGTEQFEGIYDQQMARFVI
ncbi:phage tail protein [Peptoniphilus sp. SGI.035]|uniref:phage tail-collar fiber domain-containing protein n=1 Tax=Peptoniphilus sp. SGI.035 TaxID=3420564 RepID=UPI003CFE5C50